MINRLRPDMVFLDIEMPEYSGFDLIGFFRDVDFEIIFVTAYDEFAVKAFGRDRLHSKVSRLSAGLEATASSVDASLGLSQDKRRTL